MASASNSGNYVDFDEYVGLKLEKTRSTIRSTDMLTALFGVAAMFLAYLLIFVVLDQWVIRDGFNVFWRWILLSTLMIATIAWLVWKVGLPSFRAVNGLFAAQEIEKAEPELKSNLLNLVDLKMAGRTVNPAIMKAMERQAAFRLQKVDISHAIDHRPLVRTLYVLLAIIIVCCFYAMLSPKKVMNSIWRGLLPAAQVPLATVTEIVQVKPGDVTIPAHQPSLEVQVELGGEIPQQVLLLYTSADGQQDHPIELHSVQEGQPSFRGQIVGESGQGLMQDLTYVIRAGDATSRQFKVTVEQPPYADIESLRMECPAYMKLQPIEQINNGAIDTWEGAKILLKARTNMPVRSAAIQFLDDPQAGPNGEEVVMSVVSGGRLVQAEWTLALRSDGSFPKYYRIHCKTEDGRATTGHVLNPITIRPDLPPDVVLLQPERDLEAPANAVIPLLIQARDPDFELGYLYLNIEKAKQRVVHDILSEGHQSRFTLKSDLELSKLNAAVGDEFDLWIEAYDNKHPRPNTRNTPKIKIRVTAAVSKKEAEQQFAEQNAQRDEKLSDANQDANRDQAPAASQNDSETKDRQSANDARPNDADQAPNEKPQDGTPQDRERGQTQPSDAAKPGEQNQNGDQQNGSGQAKSGQQAKPGQKGAQQKSAQTPNDQTEAGSKPKSPLSNDGSEDDEAIRRIRDKMNQKTSKQTPPNGESNSNPTKETPTPNDPSKSDDPSETSENKAQPEQKNDSQNDKSKPQSENKKNSENNSAKPSKQNSAAKNPAKTASGDQQESGGSKDAKDASEQKKQSSDETNDQQGTNTDPQKSADKPNASDKAPENPDAMKTEKNSGDDSANESKPSMDRKSEAKPTTDHDETKADQKNESGNAGQESSSGSDKPEPPSKDNPAGSEGKSSSEADSPKPEGEEKGGTSKSEASNKKDARNSTAKKPDPNAPKEQVPDSPNSKKDVADGSEEGTGRPDHDPDAKPTPTKNKNVKSDPNEKPATRPSQSPPDETTPTRKPSTDKSKSPKPVVPSEEDQPTNSDRDSQSVKQGQDEGAQDGQNKKSGSQQKGKGTDSQESNDDKSEKLAGESQDSQKPKGTEQKADQNSDKSTESASDNPSKSDSTDKTSKPKNKNGENKRGNESPSTPNDPGNSKESSESSPKQKSNEQPSGDDQSSDPKSNSKPPKDNNSTRESDGKSGKKDGKGSGSQESQSKSKGQSSNAGEKTSNSGGKSSPDGTGTPNGSPNGGESGSGDGAGLAPGEDANLEYNRQATELVLQKLKRDLERGDTDPELLKEFGWTESELKKFADRVSKSLNESKLPAETPEAKARQQQFQEMLKSLDLQKAGSQRTGAKEPKRDVNQVDSKRTPLPSAYRSAQEKLTKELARQKQPATDKTSK